MKNETTLVVGILGSGKTTLACHAIGMYNRYIVITNYSNDFTGVPCLENFYELTQDFSGVFYNEDDVFNEMAMRYAYERGEGLLVVDEAHFYFESEILKKIVRGSRHKKLDIIFLSHCMFDFARINRHLFQNVVVMKMTDDNGVGDPFELSYIERMFAEGVKDLKQYEFKIIKGNLPRWLNKKDLTFTKNVYRLNQVNSLSKR